MISYVRGELAAIEEQKAIIDVGGVGYGVFMSQQSLSLLPPAGNEVKIYTYLNVKEDALQLFGFLTRDDLDENIGAGTVSDAGGGMQAEAVQALVALGYGSAESLRAVKKTSPDCETVEDILKEALKYLF